MVFALNIYADKFSKERLKYLTKPLLVPLIIEFYCLSADPINWLIVLGLFGGFLGDAFLLGKKDIFKVLGACSFLIGHVFYIIAFISSINHFENIPLWFYLFIIPYLLYGIILLRALWKYLDNKKIPSIIYMSALFTMSFSALCRIWNGFDLAFMLPFTGSIFFIASDSCLAWQTFVEKSDKHEAFIMITYVVAQVLIMLGFLW